MLAKLSASQNDVRHRRPDFVVHVEVSDNTTARLFAYRDVGSAVNGGRGFVAAGDGQPAPVRSAGLGLGLSLNASSHNADLNPFIVPSTIQEDYDAAGFNVFVNLCVTFQAARTE